LLREARQTDSSTSLSLVRMCFSLVRRDQEKAMAFVNSSNAMVTRT
jgi:hypothetical protein